MAALDLMVVSRAGDTGVMSLYNNVLVPSLQHMLH